MKTRTTVTFYLAMALICVGILAFRKYEEKRYSVSYTEAEWNARYTWIAASKQLIERSNVPMDQGRPLVDSLNKFMNELSMQLVPQLKPQVADSTKKKK